MKDAELARRRARVARVNAKRPEIVVEVAHQPQSRERREALLDLLLELLDSRIHSR